MRLSSTILALPALAAAAESGGIFGQYRAQFQNLLGQLGVAPASEGADSSAPAAAAGSASAASAVIYPLRSTSSLTVNDWKDTLYAPVQDEATTPEEWWVLVTGGNKTCFGKLPFFLLCAMVPSHAVY